MRAKSTCSGGGAALSPSIPPAGGAAAEKRVNLEPRHGKRGKLWFDLPPISPIRARPEVYQYFNDEHLNRHWNVPLFMDEKGRLSSGNTLRGRFLIRRFID
jgi:hypothetical protein